MILNNSYFSLGITQVLVAILYFEILRLSPESSVLWFENIAAWVFAILGLGSVMIAISQETTK